VWWPVTVAAVSARSLSSAKAGADGPRGRSVAPARTGGKSRVHGPHTQSGEGPAPGLRRTITGARVSCLLLLAWLSSVRPDQRPVVKNPGLGQARPRKTSKL